MKRIAFLLVLSLVAFSSCSAKLTMTASAPVADNDGTCTVPVLIAVSSGSPRMMHFSWTGPTNGEDSVSTVSGSVVSVTRTVAPGVYTIREWASDAGGSGCDTIFTRTVKGPPWKVAAQ